MSLGDVAWLLVLLGACGGMLALAYRIEPHWSRADGSRFNCFTQVLATDGHATGRWREGRAELVGDQVTIRPKLFLRAGRHADTLRVVGRGRSSGRGKTVFLLEGAAPEGGFVALRLPARSPACRRLDELVP